MPQPPQARALVGRILLMSSAMMLGLAAALWFGVIPGEGSTRQLVAAVLGVAAVADAVIGLRFLGES